MNTTRFFQLITGLALAAAVTLAGVNISQASGPSVAIKGAACDANTDTVVYTIAVDTTGLSHLPHTHYMVGHPITSWGKNFTFGGIWGFIQPGQNVSTDFIYQPDVYDAYQPGDIVTIEANLKPHGENPELLAHDSVTIRCEGFNAPPGGYDDGGRHGR